MDSQKSPYSDIIVAIRQALTIEDAERAHEKAVALAEKSYHMAKIAAQKVYDEGEAKAAATLEKVSASILERFSGNYSDYQRATAQPSEIYEAAVARVEREAENMISLAKATYEAVVEAADAALKDAKARLQK